MIRIHNAHKGPSGMLHMSPKVSLVSRTAKYIYEFQTQDELPKHHRKQAAWFLQDLRANLYADSLEVFQTQIHISC